jgi:hypothetical protein
MTPLPPDSTTDVNNPAPASELKGYDDLPVHLSTIVDSELRLIDARRAHARPKQGLADRESEDVLQDAWKRGLVGLALSGGGIRSATFNLGVLQGLAGLNLLPLIDYLSTVSGGGYIGSCFTAWVQRNAKRGRETKQSPCGLRAVQSQLAAPPPEEQNREESGGNRELYPINHLRRYSNYLAPREGFLSVDSWVLGAIYLRNLLLNLLVLVPATVLVLLVVRLVMLLYYPWSPSTETPSHESVVAMAVVSALLGLGMVAGLLFLFYGAAIVESHARNKAYTKDKEQQEDHENDKELKEGAPAGKQITSWWLSVFTVALLVWAVLFCSLVPYELLLRHYLGWLLPSLWTWVAELAVFAVPCSLLAGLSFLILALLRWKACGLRLRRTWIILGAGLVGGGLLYAPYLLLHGLYTSDANVWARDYIRAHATAQVMTFGPALVLATIVLAIFGGVGLFKQRISEELREWLSSVCARVLIAATLWLSVNLIALYGTRVVLWASPWVGAALGSGWLITVIGGVLAGSGPHTGLRRPPNPALELLARIAPSVFMAGLLIAVSLLLHVLIDNPPRWHEADELVWLRHRSPERPPTRVTISTTKGSADVPGGPQSKRDERRDVTERAELVDDAEIIQQMYWVGILNTDPQFLPIVKGYKSFLPHFVASTVGLIGQPLRQASYLAAAGPRLPPLWFDTREELDKFFDECPLFKNTPYAARFKIIQSAKHVKSMEWNALKLFCKLFGWLLGCCLVLIVATRSVDVNLFSMHAMYRNRLVRCYLGASRWNPPKAKKHGSQVQPPDLAEKLVDLRDPDPVTEFDPADDLWLADLRVKDDGSGYDGPFLIVNTTMNLLRGNRLDWQERKAESFVLTPLYCGSFSTGYRPTPAEDPNSKKDSENAGYGNNIGLGTAVTVSGAAASPNMGYHSSPAVTALLTVFNARLGAWLGNPASPTRWREASPALGFLYLFRELFGATREKGESVYLSDGGHFENLGAYELVRRHCRYIIVSDAGQDSDHCFEDLGNLIHKCRVDFGIDIEIDLDTLHKNEQGRCRWHCAIGRIYYEKKGAEATPGTLLYIKPSLTGDEPADVLYYAERDPAFPHDTTGNQFYNESQFESYRALGQHITEAVFNQSVVEMEEDLARDGLTRDNATHIQQCGALFSSIERRWYAMPPTYESSFVESSRAIIGVQEALRQDERLRRLTLDLYPELDPEGRFRRALPKETADQEVARRCAELHAILQMLQVLESAWLSLNLEVHYTHPLNRGWLDIFYRWTNAEIVHQHWPLLRSELARSFVSFCEKQMRVTQVVGRPVKILPSEVRPERLARLFQEFQNEWPGEAKSLKERIDRILDNGDSGGWLIYATKKKSPLEESVAQGAAEASPLDSEQTPCGIILVSPTAASNVHELFVWLRGAYRNTGLGQSALRTVLNDIPATLGELSPNCGTDDAWLRVCLPGGKLNGRGDELQRRMWLTFFHHLGFERIDPPKHGKQLKAPAVDSDGEETQIVLKRPIR